MPSARACGLPFLIGLTLFSIACGGEPPDNEIQQAQGALDAARAAGADRYAVDEFKAAEDALKRAHDAVADRDYRLALNNALDSRDRAQNAVRQAAAGRAAQRVEADRSLSAAIDALAAARTRTKGAEGSRPAAKALDAARAAISHAEALLQEARSAFDKSDYMVAAAQARAVTNALTVATSDLDAAAAGSTHRRR